MKLSITLVILVAICHWTLADVSHLTNSHEDRYYLPPLTDKDRSASAPANIHRIHGHEKKSTHGSTHHKISQPRGLPDPPLVPHEHFNTSPTDRSLAPASGNLFIPASSERVVYASAPNSIFHTQINVQSQDNDYNAPPPELINGNLNNGQNAGGNPQPFNFVGFDTGNNGFNAALVDPSTFPQNGNTFQNSLTAQNGFNGQNAGGNDQITLTLPIGNTLQNGFNGQNRFSGQNVAANQQPFIANAGLNTPGFTASLSNFRNNVNPSLIPFGFNGNGQNVVGRAPVLSNTIGFVNPNNGNQFPNANNFNLAGSATNGAGRTATLGVVQRNRNDQGFNRVGFSNVNNNFGATTPENRAQTPRAGERKINYQGVNIINGNLPNNRGVPTTFAPNPIDTDSNAQLGNILSGNLFGAASQQSSKVSNAGDSTASSASKNKKTAVKKNHHHHHNHKSVQQKQTSYNNDNFEYSHSANAPPEVIYQPGDHDDVGTDAKGTRVYTGVSGAFDSDGHNTDLRDDGYHYGKPSISFNY